MKYALGANAYHHDRRRTRTKSAKRGQGAATIASAACPPPSPTWPVPRTVLAYETKQLKAPFPPAGRRDRPTPHANTGPNHKVSPADTAPKLTTTTSSCERSPPPTGSTPRRANTEGQVSFCPVTTAKRRKMPNTSDADYSPKMPRHSPPTTSPPTKWKSKRQKKKSASSSDALRRLPGVFNANRIAARKIAGPCAC